MKRIAILTAGGDTPALNATILGAVQRACELRVEILGVIKGFSGLLNPELPHVHLNPLLQPIPELDPTLGGTVLGASRDYVDANDRITIHYVADRLHRLSLDGLICIGGDGTVNGMQPLSEFLPCVLAPKTIDNDLGLNYRDEADEWVRDEAPETPRGYQTRKKPGRSFALEEMINYATPGYATAVYVSTHAMARIRTTAESHRRIAIIEVMGRDSGMIALGTAYGQPDIILVPEVPFDRQRLVDRVMELYEIQKHAVICVSEGIRDKTGHVLGSISSSKDPAGNQVYSGAAMAIKAMLVEEIGDDYFRRQRRNESASAAVFVRKVGHTQRGGRPIRFDRFHAAQLGGKAVDMLLQGRNNCLASLQYAGGEFCYQSIDVNQLRDRWGEIHARPLSTTFYDAERFRPSEMGITYLDSIFVNALGPEDVEAVRPIFNMGALRSPYHSVNVDIARRIRRIDT